MDEELRIRALSELLGVEQELIEVSPYDEKLLIVNPHTVRDGTSPNKARKLVAQLREALGEMMKFIKPHGRIIVGKNIPFLSTPERVLSDDVSTWRTIDFQDAYNSEQIRKWPLPDGDVPATYDNLVRLMRECPTSAEMLKEGIHDVVNTLYFLCPDSLGYPETASINDHRKTVAEAFNGLEIQDRTKPRQTDDGEYLVLTDDEADQKWDESLESYLDECVEGADSRYFDREKWKEDAKIDGRGHSLSGYDGTEHEVTVEFGDEGEEDEETFYIFRQN